MPPVARFDVDGLRNSMSIVEMKLHMIEILHNGTSLLLEIKIEKSWQVFAREYIFAKRR